MSEVGKKFDDALDYVGSALKSATEDIIDILPFGESQEKLRKRQEAFQAKFQTEEDLIEGEFEWFAGLC